MAVALGKENVACIVHIKSSFGGFPKEDLEEKLRGMPAGSFLELETTINGAQRIATGIKYINKSTNFFVATKGAAPTSAGEPYIGRGLWLECTRLTPRPTPEFVDR